MKMGAKIALIATTIIVFSSPVGFRGWADEGEELASDSHRLREHCQAVAQYGEQPAPVGPVTGDPEKDTYAYPVKRIDSRCSAARP